MECSGHLGVPNQGQRQVGEAPLVIPAKSGLDAGATVRQHASQSLYKSMSYVGLADTLSAGLAPLGRVKNPAYFKLANQGGTTVLKLHGGERQHFSHRSDRNC